MKNIIIYLVISLLVLLSFTFKKLQSQTFSKEADSIVNANTQKLIQAYEFYGGLTENEMSISRRYIKEFKKIFSNDVYFFNDIFTGEKWKENIPLDAYINGIIENFPSGLSITLKIINKSKPEFDTHENKGFIIIDVTKSILGIDINDNIIRKEVDLSFCIGFNGEFSDFKILEVRKKKIEYKEIAFQLIDAESGKPIPEITLNLYYDGEFKQSGTSSKNYGRIVFKDIPSGTRIKISIGEDQGYIKEEFKEMIVDDWINSKEKLKLFLKKYKVWKKINLEGFITPSLSKINTINEPNNYILDSYNNKGSILIQGGVLGSYFFKDSKKNKFGIGTGLTLYTYSSDINIDSYSQNPYDTVDIQKDNYQLFVNSNEIQDKITLSYLEVPIMLKFRSSVNSKILDYFYLDLGLRFSFLLGNKSNLGADITTQGYYQEWDIVLYDIDELDYFTEQAIDSKSELDISSTSISGFLGFGISIPIKKPELNLNLGFEYCRGVSNISNYNVETYYFSKGFNDYNSVLGSSSKLTTQSLGFKIGISYDIFK